MQSNHRETRRNAGTGGNLPVVTRLLSSFRGLTMGAALYTLVLPIIPAGYSKGWLGSVTSYVEDPCGGNTYELPNHPLKHRTVPQYAKQPERSKTQMSGTIPSAAEPSGELETMWDRCRKTHAPYFFPWQAQRAGPCFEFQHPRNHAKPLGTADDSLSQSGLTCQFLQTDAALLADGFQTSDHAAEIVGIRKRPLPGWADPREAGGFGECLQQGGRTVGAEAERDHERAS